MSRHGGTHGFWNTCIFCNFCVFCIFYNFRNLCMHAIFINLIFILFCNHRTLTYTNTYSNHAILVTNYYTTLHNHKTHIQTVFCIILNFEFLLLQHFWYNGFTFSDITKIVFVCGDILILKVCDKSIIYNSKWLQ